VIDAVVSDGRFAHVGGMAIVYRITPQAMSLFGSGVTAVDDRIRSITSGERRPCTTHRGSSIRRRPRSIRRFTTFSPATGPGCEVVVPPPCCVDRRDSKPLVGTRRIRPDPVGAWPGSSGGRSAWLLHQHEVSAP
jgi:hypothetical protein